MIAVIDNKYDIVLCRSWSNLPRGINGHVYEIIEYYHILKDHFRVAIALCEPSLNKKHLLAAIQDKYDFTQQEIDELMNDTFEFDNPKILKGKALFLVDGNFTKLASNYLYFDHIMSFACGDFKFQTMPHITVFQDCRFYPHVEHGVDYIKKILFSRYNQLTANPQNVNLVYVTQGPREITPEVFADLEQYPGDFLVLTDINIDKSLISNRFSVLEMPVYDLFNTFSTYIYTPVVRQFDCSPRFIAECKWYDKPVIYHNIDYWEHDCGLRWRKRDIDNNFESIHLTSEDSIVELVRNVIEQSNK